MEGFSDRLRQLIDALAPHAQAFAGAIGQAPNKVYGYLKGENIPKADVISGIAAAYPSVNVRWLLTGEGAMLDESYRIEYDSGLGDAKGQGRVGIPIVSRIRAGLSTFYEIEHYAEHDRLLPLDPKDVSDAGDRPFGLLVEGDSMAPFMLPGDVAVCSAFRKPDVGDDVAFYRARTGESTIKRLDGLDTKAHRIKLLPLNPAYAPFTTTIEPGDQIALVLAVMRYSRPLGKRRTFTV